VPVALLDWRQPVVGTVEFKKVEGAQCCARQYSVAADHVEHRSTVRVAYDRFAVDQARPDR
jgi:hypothetical protein